MTLSNTLFYKTPLPFVFCIISTLTNTKNIRVHANEEARCVSLPISQKSISSDIEITYLHICIYRPLPLLTALWISRPYLICGIQIFPVVRMMIFWAGLLMAFNEFRFVLFEFFMLHCYLLHFDFVRCFLFS